MPANEMSAMTQASDASRLRAGSRRSTAASRTPTKPNPARTTDAEAAVEVTVKVAVATPDPDMVTEGLDRAQATGSLEPAGDVTLQVRPTAPMKPPEGVIEITAEFPLVAPGATVMEPLPLRAMAGVIGVSFVTVTVEVVVSVILPVATSVPVTVST
jgi:hypothetical protein